MTTLHVVEDDVLGKVSKKIWELTRRILEGAVNPLRSMFYIQSALEGVPYPTSLSYSYLIEGVWSGIETQRDFATITLETHGQNAPTVFEIMMTEHVPRLEKNHLLGLINKVWDAQVPNFGSRGRRHVYRILGTRHFGGIPNSKEVTVERTFTLKPLFDIDEAGNPVPYDLKS
jgi:hypothetical protein